MIIIALGVPLVAALSYLTWRGLQRPAEQSPWTDCAIRHGARHPSACGECAKEQRA